MRGEKNDLTTRFYIRWKLELEFIIKFSFSARLFDFVNTCRETGVCVDVFSLSLSSSPRVHRFPANLFYLRINVERHVALNSRFIMFSARRRAKSSSHQRSKNIQRSEAKRWERVAFYFLPLNETRLVARNSCTVFFDSRQTKSAFTPSLIDRQLRRDRSSSRFALSHSRAKKKKLRHACEWIHHDRVGTMGAMGTSENALTREWSRHEKSRQPVMHCRVLCKRKIQGGDGGSETRIKGRHDDGLCIRITVNTCFRDITTVSKQSIRSQVCYWGIRWKSARNGIQFCNWFEIYACCNREENGAKNRRESILKNRHTSQQNGYAIFH